MNAEAAKPGADIAPVVLLVFKRPEPTARLLACLREVKPQVVFVVADGPRPDVSGETESCARVRQLIDRGIDWPARVVKDYADLNLGARERVSTGLSWVFGQVDRAIVLEDDCLPHPTFFRFCSELLEHYRHDTRVSAVSGDRFLPASFPIDTSYYFSRYTHSWGWATWRRAWRFYDDEMRHWPELRDSGWLEAMFPHPLEAALWREIFDSVHQRREDAWDYPWTYACWRQNLLAVVPAVNLVTNIGTGEDASNTKGAEPLKHNLPAVAAEFPLVHPDAMVRHHVADDWTQLRVFGRAKDRTWRGRLVRPWIKLARTLRGE